MPQPLVPHTHIGNAACAKPAAQLSLHAAPLGPQLLVENLSAASGLAVDAAVVVVVVVVEGSLGGCRACLEVLVAGLSWEATG